jgi:hypothetical protein
MQDLLLGSLGLQLVAFAQRHPWPVFAGVLVVTLIVVDLLRRNRSSSTGGDFDFGLGGGDGDGGCGD